MTVESRGVGDGTAYFVVKSPLGEALAGPFTSSAAAWRWIDRQEGEPTSRSEKTSEWVWQNRVHGE